MAESEGRRGGGAEGSATIEGRDSKWGRGRKGSVTERGQAERKGRRS